MMSSYQNKKSHCGDKAAVRKYNAHNGIFYTGKKDDMFIWNQPPVVCGYILKFGRVNKTYGGRV